MDGFFTFDFYLKKSFVLKFGKQNLMNEVWCEWECQTSACQKTKH